MTGKLHQALDALASVSVTGINHSYDMSTVPERLGRASMPILIALPMMDGGGLRKHSEAQVFTPSGSNIIVEYYITHLLLYATPGMYRNVGSSLPGLVDLIDNYGVAMKANLKLGGLLYVPLTYYVMPGDIEWGGVPYLGARFVHRFVIEQ